MTARFIPSLWEPAMLEQLKSQVVISGFLPDAPRPPRERYTLVHEGSYLSAVIEDDVTAFVPDEEAAEAVQVMIDALNEWITAKKAAE